jgi:prokaryotic ubiquitin-like protein Pup
LLAAQRDAGLIVPARLREGGRMEKQEKKTDTKRGGAQPKDEAKASAKVVEAGKKLKEDMDKLIDEIDDVLEENAEEFIKNYVQKGGE